MLLCVDGSVLCDTLKLGMEPSGLRSAGKAGGADEGGASKDSCEERPPILWSPQNGASSRELVVV